jgi:nitrogen regulatory protein P-II 2
MDDSVVRNLRAFCRSATFFVASQQEPLLVRGAADRPAASYFERSALMKFVSAVIKPQKLDDVREALVAVGVSGLTVTDVRGYGRQKGHTETYRGAEYSVDFRPKVKIEIAIPSDRLGAVLEAIRSKANAGAIGDGKIFVFDLEDVVRVRTGETGAAAL